MGPFKSKHIILKTLRIIVGIILAYGLILATLKSTGGDFWHELAISNTHLLILTLIFYGAVAITLPVYRWHILLKVQGIKLQAWDLIRLTMVGNFFSMALPGTVSGDLVKMVYVARQTQNKRTESVLTILLDRALGLIGLFILAALMVLAYWPFLLSLPPAYRPIQIAALLVCIASILGILFFFCLWFRQNIQSFLRLDSLLSNVTKAIPRKFAQPFFRLLNAFDLYRSNFKTIVIGIVISVLIHASLAVILWSIGKSIGEDDLRMGDYFLATQVSSAIAIIPLTPGGIGMRDVTIAAIFSAKKAAPEKIGVLPVILTLMTLFLKLIGGGFFMFSSFPKELISSEPPPIIDLERKEPGD